MRKSLWIIAVVMVLFAAVVAADAHADEVVYTFVATDTSFPGGQLAFQLTVPDFINTPVGIQSLFFTCAQLDSSTNCGDTVSLWISTGPSPDQVDFGATNSIDYAFGFDPGSFTTPGTYTCCGNVASLTVATVPEPSSGHLIVTGIAMIGILTRRKLLQSANVH